jgi:hypothetical protein
LVIVLGVALTWLGAGGLWDAVEETLHGVPGIANVIEYHAAASRSMTVLAQVEVTVPGERPFRTQLQDTFGAGSWSEGGTVRVVCTGVHTGVMHCNLDSAMDRWLLPILLFVVGLGAIAGGAWIVARRSN